MGVSELLSTETNLPVSAARATALGYELVRGVAHQRDRTDVEAEGYPRPTQAA